MTLTQFILFGWLAATLQSADIAADHQRRFDQQVRPFLEKFCMSCHDADEMKSGIRVDNLTGVIEDRHVKLWGHILDQVKDAAMPPEDAKRHPSEAERTTITNWIKQALLDAQSRPTPKNGSVRRLTREQYRHTLRELLLLDEDIADILPPDAVSKDGFVNNAETLALSPIQAETYFDLAGQALECSLVIEDTKPTIQNFRVDLGTGINREPCPDKLILGAGSLLLENSDVLVTQLKANKPFAFEPYWMQTEFRFIEGYIGNGTIREWKDFHGIYHAVFACMRGQNGYPKGMAYGVVPQGLLLRPAVPPRNDRTNYGPMANFKISLRELPNQGRFRVTVTAAKYQDALLLDTDARPQSNEVEGTIQCLDPADSKTVSIPKAGIYQVDVIETEAEETTISPDASRLNEGLIGAWSFDGNTKSTSGNSLEAQLHGNVKYARSPFGDAAAFATEFDSVIVTRHESMNVGTGDFTLAAWINPTRIARGGIISAGRQNRTYGWCFRIESADGSLRFESSGPDNDSNGTITAPKASLVANKWQHVSVVIRRNGESTILVNGYQVGRGPVGDMNLDNLRMDLRIGNVEEANAFRGEIDDVRFYRRALEENEIEALVEPGRQFVTKSKRREKSRDLNLEIGDRQFSSSLKRPAFMVLRLEAGDIRISSRFSGMGKIERLVLTPLSDDHENARRFQAFETRSPRVGVHLGLRRDCGSSLLPVSQPQTVASETPSTFAFEGAIRDYPSPDVEKNNVNYLAGVREIGIRSEYTDGRDMPRLMIRSVEFEGPLYENWPPASHRNLIPAADDSESAETRAQKAIASLATRAFRRPVSEVELSKFLSVYAESVREGRSFQESLKNAFKVILASPQFLFIVEHSKGPEAEPIDEYELASKLSYFVWNSPPDGSLIELASTNSLRPYLDAQLNRMIHDHRFERFTSEFVSQWLALDKFEVLEPDLDRFPKLFPDNRKHLAREPVEFVQYLMRNNLPLSNLIDSDFILANEAITSFYDLQDRPDTGFAFVPLVHHRSELGGVLAQAAIMAGLSDGRESNPIKRGAWFARRIVAEPPDDPPPNVPALKEETAGLSLRERLFQHRNQRGCAQCHSKIDPWGVPFEEFDAGGRLKKEAVDASSTLPHKTKVSGFKELKQILAKDRIDQVAFSFLKHLAVYATGRDLSYNETDYLRQHGLKLKDDGYRMQDMIRFVVHSPIFLEK